MNPGPFLIVAGPTASGKSKLAMTLAARLNGELVCADSVQLYKGFCIGSAMPSEEERRQIPHHLFESCHWHQEMSAGRYQQWARQAIIDIQQRQKVAIVVGGTGLYLRALMGTAWHDQSPQDSERRLQLSQLTTPQLWQRLARVDPQRQGQLHPNDRVRIIRALELFEVSGRTHHQRTVSTTQDQQSLWQKAAFFIVLSPDRSLLHQRISTRLEFMLAQGWRNECETLLSMGVDPQAKPMQSIGYRQWVDYLQGRISEQELSPKILAATRQYAKRQDTWFKGTSADLRLDVNAGTQFEQWADTICEQWLSRCRRGAAPCE